jgi:hypothetical protein
LNKHFQSHFGLSHLPFTRFLWKVILALTILAVMALLNGGNSSTTQID